MISKVFFSPNDEFKPVVLAWSNEMEDYVFEQIPDGLTRQEVIDLLDEIKHVTRWDEYYELEVS